MADEMNTERDMPEGITRDDTVHGETYYTASDMATASAQGFRDGVASLSAPLQSALDVIERWARDAYVVCGKPATQEGFEAAWKAEDADAYAVWVAGRASLAANAPAATAADGKWYMLSRDGMATLCADRDDAMKEVARADKLYPAGAPHSAVQLVAANAVSEPVAYCFAEELQSATENGDVFDAWTKESTGAMPLYAHPSPPEGMAGWMPIETAPRGISVLLYIGGSVTPMYCGRRRFGTLGEPQQDEYAWRCDSSGWFAKPTHWMPLPASPTIEGESK